MKVNDLLCAACGICVAVVLPLPSPLRVKRLRVTGQKAGKSSRCSAVELCANCVKNALDGLDAAVEAVPCGSDITSK